jgi:hypothetical protein
VPPDAQPEALANGPQAKKVTLPVGLPPAGLPATVAVSVFGLSTTTSALAGAEVVVDAALLTVTHSPLEPSLDVL